MNPRFFVDPKQISGDTVTISGEELTHLARVLRLKPGSCITVCDGSGQECQAILQEILPGMAMARIVQRVSGHAEPRVKITLVQGLPKADKMELIIQKGTELGICEFLPVLTERTVVKLSRTKAERRVERWQRIAKEAAKQSQRTIIPKIHFPIPWRECLSKYSEKGQGRLGLFPWEAVSNKSLREVLSANEDWKPGDLREIWLFIGPEGGWSETEAGEAGALGIISLSLGPRILRTETAGIVAASLVLYENGDLG